MRFRNAGQRRVEQRLRGFRSHGLLLWLGVVLCFGSPGFAGVLPDSSDLGKAHSFERLSQAFFAREQARSGPRATAMSIGVNRDGALVYTAGLGVPRPNQATTIETPFHIGSITKQFTALALLELLESQTLTFEGKRVSLDTPVSAILPNLVAWDDEVRPRILIRHILSMTANVPNFTRRPPVDLSPWNAVAEGQLLTAIGRYVPAGPPVEFEYSNTCYFLAAEIIDALVRERGETFEEVVRKTVIEKAGLEHTRFWGKEAKAALPNYSRRPAFVDGVWLKGSANLVSSVKDLLRWNATLVDGQTFSKAARDHLFSESARVDVETWYGMGWFRREKGGKTFFSHSGSVPGYTAYNLIIQNADGHWSSCVVLANGDQIDDMSDFAEELARLALD